MHSWQWLMIGLVLVNSFGCAATGQEPPTTDSETDGNEPPMIPDTAPTDGCSFMSGGTCNCVLTCGANKFSLDCNGNTCTCTQNGMVMGSFQQASACTYSGDSQAYAYSIIIAGCPQAYPCD